MKYLKPYQLFESKDIIMAGVWNSFDKKNPELFKNLVHQYGSLIDYNPVVEYIFKHCMEYENYDGGEFKEYLKHVPEPYLTKFVTINTMVDINLDVFKTLVKERGDLIDYNYVIDYIKTVIKKGELSKDEIEKYEEMIKIIPKSYHTKND